MSCMKHAEYQYIRHLKPKGNRIHLHFGGCVARGLEVFRKDYYGVNRDFDYAMQLAINALIHEWGYVEPPDFGSGANKNFEACVAAILSFFDEYPPDTDPVTPVMTSEGPAVEWSFALPIPGIFHPESGDPMLYCGRFDMLAEYGGAVFVDDEKTASQLGAGWAKNWRLASQMTGYCWAAKEYGYNVQGVIIRGIGILKNDIKHQFVMEQRAQWMIDRWLIQLQHDVRRLIASWQSGYYDYALDDACSSYGGCEFMPLCTSKDPEPWIEADYEINRWDPLEK